MSDLAKIEVNSHKRVDVVTVSGRIDSSNAPELDAALKGLLESGRTNIILAMSDANYMSSAGLRAIVTALRTAKKNRGDVRLAAPSERIVEVLKLAGLEEVFETYDDEVSAVGSF